MRIPSALARTAAPRRAAAIAALSATLAGCAAVGPDYHAEPPIHPQAWSTPLAGAAPVDPAALAQWWRAFDDPLLDELLQQALAHNQDLAIARLRLLQARAERDQVASRLGPDVGARADATASRTSLALRPPGVG
ncbi:TolC family protein, partial [Achromobacter insuavis]